MRITSNLDETSKEEKFDNLFHCGKSSTESDALKTPGLGNINKLSHHIKPVVASFFSYLELIMYNPHVVHLETTETQVSN